jgi:hypothetical protein
MLHAAVAANLPSAVLDAASRRGRAADDMTAVALRLTRV